MNAPLITPVDVVAAAPLIETRGLGRAFKGRLVLRDVDLTVNKGEIFGILGPDGAGKTTLMQMLAAILDPSEGSCSVMGKDTVKDAYWINSHIGYMFQGFTLYDMLSVSENMDFSAQIRGVPKELYAERRDKLLRMAGLLRFMDRPAGNLSGGMRKKLSLCANLVHEPPLLLLDELSLGVDPASRRELWDILHAYRSGGTTVVVTTPYMDEAQHCDRLAFLDEGRVLAIDTTAALNQRCAGRVFEVAPKDRAAIHNILRGDDQVISIRHLAEHVHFQIRETQPISPALRDQLASVAGPIEPAPSSLDDAFIALSGGEKGAAYAPPPPKLHLAAKPPEGGRIHSEGLTVRFGDFIANDHVTLDIAPGEVFGFLGANGAGKTTFIRTLCGLTKATEGDAWIGGLSVTTQAAQLRQHIGYMSQRFSLYPDLSVAENLEFFAGIYGLRRGERKLAIDWVKSATQLEGYENQLVMDMSGALGQRVALACAIMHQPSVVFLDEPTSGVGPSARYSFWQLIQTLAESGTTIFVTTHYLEEANYCHRLGMMHMGRLIGVGTAAELAAELPNGAQMETIEEIFLAHIQLEDERHAAKVGTSA